MLLFEKLLLILKKKDAKHYTYKGHILVSPPPHYSPYFLHIFTPLLPSSIFTFHHSPFSVTFSWPLHPTLTYLSSSFLLSLSLSLSAPSSLLPFFDPYPIFFLSCVLHLLPQRDELSLADDTHSGASNVFKVFSRHHRHQSYAIHTNTKLAMQEWVGKIRQLKEEENMEQVVST